MNRIPGTRGLIRSAVRTYRLATVVQQAQLSRSCFCTGRTFSTTPRSLAPHPKVEALPFRISTSDALSQLQFPATFATIVSGRNFWEAMKFAFFRFLGWGGMGWGQETKVDLVDIKAVYIPVWIIDSTFDIKCRKGEETAVATVVTTNSYHPGFHWPPLSALRLATAYEGMEFERFDPTVHLQPRDVDIPEGVTLLPFQMHPLYLPKAIRDLPKKEAKLGDEQVFETKAQREEHEQAMGMWEQTSFEPASLDVKLLAAYPLLWPIYIAEYRVGGDESGKSTTMILTADTEKGRVTTPFFRLDNSKPRWPNALPWFNLDFLGFARASGGFRSLDAKVAQTEIHRGAIWGDIVNDVQPWVRKWIQRDPADWEGLVEGQVERVPTWRKYLLQHGGEGETKGVSAEEDERNKQLGEIVPWSSPLVQRFSRCSEQNREYVGYQQSIHVAERFSEALGWTEKDLDEAVASEEEAVNERTDEGGKLSQRKKQKEEEGEDVDRKSQSIVIQLGGNGLLPRISKTDATSHARFLRDQKKSMEEAKPEWLRDWEAGEKDKWEPEEGGGWPKRKRI